MIQLTINHSGQPVWISPDYIISLLGEMSNDDHTTSVQVMDSDYCYVVRESPEEILRLMKEEEVAV